MALILAFDTSAGHCAAAVLDGDEVLAAQAEEMTRGQAERLFPLLQAVLDKAGRPLSDMTCIGVGTGPGNFTGTRIAVAAARGLSLSRDIPAIGVSTFEVIRLLWPGAAAGVPAPRGTLHLLRPGASEPEAIAADAAPEVKLPPPPVELAITIARLAARVDPATCAPPAPLYLRPADAVPPRDAPPEIVA